VLQHALEVLTRCEQPQNRVGWDPELSGVPPELATSDAQDNSVHTVAGTVWHYSKHAGRLAQRQSREPGAA
jgi:hypothetical protein